MSGRARILGAIRRSLGRGPITGAEAADLARRIEQPARNLVPARAQLPKAEQVELYCAKAQAIDVTIDRVAGTDDVPAAVAGFLAEHNLPSDLRLAPDPDLAAEKSETAVVLDKDGYISRFDRAESMAASPPGFLHLQAD